MRLAATLVPLQMTYPDDVGNDDDNVDNASNDSMGVCWRRTVGVDSTD